MPTNPGSLNDFVKEHPELAGEQAVQAYTAELTEFHDQISSGQHETSMSPDFLILSKTVEVKMTGAA